MTRAQLIAAAPHLLWALRHAAAGFATIANNPPVAARQIAQENFEAAMVAIAKAEGRDV